MSSDSNESPNRSVDLGRPPANSRRFAAMCTSMPFRSDNGGAAADGGSARELPCRNDRAPRLEFIVTTDPRRSARGFDTRFRERRCFIGSILIRMPKLASFRLSHRPIQAIGPPSLQHTRIGNSTYFALLGRATLAARLSRGGVGQDRQTDEDEAVRAPAVPLYELNPAAPVYVLVQSCASTTASKGS